MQTSLRTLRIHPVQRLVERGVILVTDSDRSRTEDRTEYAYDSSVGDSTWFTGVCLPRGLLGSRPCCVCHQLPSPSIASYSLDALVVPPVSIRAWLAYTSPNKFLRRVINVPG